MKIARASKITWTVVNGKDTMATLVRSTVRMAMARPLWMVSSGRRAVRGFVTRPPLATDA